ncbi:thioredoxin family protein [Enterobacter roggenkampii]|uniref:protein-disulfide reductase DsbD domain-containing protein n=1 Tax=Enterobacter roggenkampii TaxID=1812935 RepID=UPI002004A9ED|nr:protein-disulfide reductase DsbD domain-containing protein [Enterobacter roggenkampii]MCK6927885.1 thioredoxin family protein [Enterobacter roggenkampii]
MVNLFRGFVFLWLSCIGIVHAADTGWLVSPQNDHARIRFQAEREQTHIKGLLTVELKPGWKTYWRSPGEGGVAPKISWPDGVTDSWSWPVPSRFDISGMTTQGYHDKVTIPITLDGAKGDTLDGTLTLSTCSNVCLLTDYPLHLDFTQPVDEGFRSAFGQAIRAVPGTSGVSSNLSAWLSGDKLVITGTTDGKWDNPGIYFDPLKGDILPGEPVIKHDGTALRVTVPVTDECGDKPASLAGKRLSFVLTNGDRAQQTTMTVGTTPEETSAPDGTGKMVLFALLGGLILNLMPCVLPVMGMKLNSILLAGSDRRAIRLRFLATSAGILTSFMLLAGMVTALKLAGASLGWGIQFQNPWFIGLMVAVTFLFALNLFGAFEMLLPSAAAGRLATLLSVHLGEAVSQIVMLGLTAVALVLFALKGQKSSPLFWLVVIALSAFGGYQVRGLLNAPPDAPAQNVAQTIPWQPLSEETIENALAQGKRVFVDISADWCVTCKVNEHRVLSQPDVIAALRQPDVVALRGDWSQPSAFIADFLAKRNRYAIPFNAVYGPGLPDGEILSPLLDKRTLVTTLNNAKG